MQARYAATGARISRDGWVNLRQFLCTQSLFGVKCRKKKICVSPLFSRTPIAANYQYVVITIHERLINKMQICKKIIIIDDPTYCSDEIHVCPKLQCAVHELVKWW